MSFLKNLWQEGKLPTVETEVDINKEAMMNLAITILIVAIIIILVIRISAPKKVIK